MGKTLLPEDFKVTDEMKAWAKQKVPSVDVESQFELFCDYWRAHGKKMMDWNATFRNWLRRAPEFERPVNRFSNFERSRPVVRGNSEPLRVFAAPANLNDNSPRFPDSRFRKQ